MDKIQNSIITKYRKDIYRPFMRAIEDFNLIEEGDKIAVCISGGKDSFLLSKCMEEVKRHGKIKFDLVYILMNPGYKKEYLDNIYENIEKMNIDVKIFKSNIFEEASGNKNACYLCARKRRGFLYSTAQKLGCNKIALGHHFNDVVETILMSVIYNGEFKTMKPILKSTNFENMKLIRPLYYVKEKSIISWANTNGLSFIGCACGIVKEKTGKRYEMKEITEYLCSKYSAAGINIMNSTKNVNLNTILSYTKEDEKEL